MPRARYRALERRVRELEWLLGKKTLENEMLHRALDLAETTLREHDPVLPDNDEFEMTIGQYRIALRCALNWRLQPP